MSGMSTHSHSHGHDGGEDRSHRGLGGHSHAPKNFGARFAVATALNAALVILQVVYGVLAHSTALLADAGHNFGDTFGLLLAWGAHVLARREPTEKFTYGFRSSSILAALLNAMILLIATGAIAWEAVLRLQNPPEIAAGAVIVVAALAAVLNGFSAWLLMSGQEDINIRGAVLHMAADAMVSVGVVVGAVVIVFTGWNWVDPVVSLLISAVIVWGTWGLLRQSVTMSLQAVPRGIEPRSVRAYLETLPGVVSIHDLHIWPMSTTETALTCHLVIPGAQHDDAFMQRICEELNRRFEIGHATIQIEHGATECRLAPDHVV